MINWRTQSSALTAVGEPGGGLVLVSDWLVLVSDWQQSTTGGGAWLEGRGLSVVVILSFGQQVTDLLLQLRTDVVLRQNQNPQAGRVVLHHVQEHLDTETDASQNITVEHGGSAAASPLT